MSSDIMPKNDSGGERVRGFDIGSGANCIYPLLGASLLGWSFVGSGRNILFSFSFLFLFVSFCFSLIEIWLQM